MASPWRPEIPLSSLGDMLGHGGEEEERQVYRRYRKRRSFGASLISHEAEKLPSIDQGLQANFAKDDPEYLTFQDHHEDLNKIKVAYEDQDATLAPRRMPHSDAAALSLKPVKLEPEEAHGVAESSFEQFASILGSALRGIVSFPDLVQQFEVCCWDLAERLREEATGRHRVIEDQLLRHKAHMLHGEAATWALLWHLYGKGLDDLAVDDNFKFPCTSQQIVCSFIKEDATAQLCFRIVQWLEGLAANALDLERKHKGWYAGSYLQKLGVWHQTQHAIRKKVGSGLLVQHLDPDAPTREQAHIQPEDQNLEDGLLEDVWKLLRAGRLEEAKELCRSAGQPWRAATLGAYGWMGVSQPIKSWRKKDNNKQLLATECESGLGHQSLLWKWACFCASEKIAENVDQSSFEAAVYGAQCGNLRRMLSVCKDWETACWAMVKSWLNVQVDVELSTRYPIIGGTHSGVTESDMNGAIVDASTTVGPSMWPQQVMNQQPQNLSSLFQKLHSRDLVHESVSQGCKECQHQVQMCIMLEDICQLLELLRAWIVPPQDSTEILRSPGNPEMMRFGAHLVLVLRHVLADDMKDQFREKLWLVGDLVLNTYSIFLLSQRREELVGIYASQLAPYLCEELYVHMMELRQQDSVLLKIKIFHSALEYIPYGPQDPSKGCFSIILDRVLYRSREVKPASRNTKFEEAEVSYEQESLEKATAVQWLCFNPPSTLPDGEQLRVDLLGRALHQSNIIFREFSLVSLSRTTKVSIGAHMLLSYLEEPLKETADLVFELQQNESVRADFIEFQDWREYYSCDALYRNWLKLQLTNASIPCDELSFEEKEESINAASRVLDATMALLQRNDDAWLAEDNAINDSLGMELLQLDAVGRLKMLSGHYVPPDATVCTALTSAFYMCAGETAAILRQLNVDVSTNNVNENYINISLRCLATKGDGIGPCVGADGGLLATLIASTIKGELEHFQPGLTLETSRLDTWFLDKYGSKTPAVYIARGLCRRCCLPELILRCMQIRVALLDVHFILKDSVNLMELIACPNSQLHQLFTCSQFKEFLLFEREYTLGAVEIVGREL